MLSYCLYYIGALPVAGVAITAALAGMWNIAEMGRQFRFQGALDEALSQLLEQAMLTKNGVRISIVFPQFV
jgi:hypothetical protein